MLATFKKAIPHIAVLVLFVVAALAYFSPVLQGDKLFQGDIVQYNGMAKQQRDFKAATGEETYWTNSAFGGMPTYQLGARYPNNFIKSIDLSIRFLPRPADYLFLYLLGMYIFLLVLKVDYKLAFLGALAFGFSTYLIIIFGAGHNLKAHAIAYMPLVLSGIVLTFRRKYFWGFVLTAIALGLELVVNHFQMTFYLLLLVLMLGAAYLVDAIRKKELKHFGTSLAVLVAAVLFSVGFNSTNLMATSQYAKESTRGQSILSVNPDGTPKEGGTGMSYEYITEYSYGKAESLNLLVPRLMGGGSGEPYPEDSQLIDAFFKLGAGPDEINQILNQVPLYMYWGDQPIIEAPAYIGAVVVFLAFLGLFLVKGRTRWWLVGAFIFSLLLSWGKNLDWFTQLFIDYFPMYNKFRAVSSIQVIIELVLPVLAVLGLHQFFNDFVQKEKRQKVLMTAGGIVAGMLVLFFLLPETFFSFTGPYDAAVQEALGEAGPGILEGLQEDRIAVMKEDTLRSLIFVLLTIGVLWTFLKGFLKENVVILALAVLIVVDLVGIDRRYVNNEDFVDARVMEQPFNQHGADVEVLKDKDPHFRVFDLTTNAFKSGRASYYHNALGGYSAVKLQRIQDVYDFYLSNQNMGVLNMFNVRYLMEFGDNGGVYASRNPYANGNAWFVSDYELVDTDDQEIQKLNQLDSKNKAIIHSEFKEFVSGKTFAKDSTSQIKLIEVDPNTLRYTSTNKSDGLAVFSEVYYKPGWEVTIDGQPAEHFRANYALRALAVPAGTHEIVFEFNPKVVANGSTITVITWLVFLLVCGGVWFLINKKKKAALAAQ